MRPNWFVAVPVNLPPAFTEALSPPPGIRVFHPADLHVTIAFFGGVDEASARAGFAHAASHPWAPIDATLSAVAPFGKPSRPSAFSAELDVGKTAATELIAALRDPCLEAAGCPPDRWAPRPHITLARPMRRATDAERAAGLAWATDLDVAGMPVRLDEVALYTWAPDRRARLFTTVSRSPASPGSPG